MTTNHLFIRAAAFAGLACLAGCVYTNKQNNLSYVFNTHYNVFDIKNEPAFTFSNFVGYCLMPMRDPHDIRSVDALLILEKYISENGYVKVLPAEMLADGYVASRTFLVSFCYVESYFDGTLEFQLNLHAIDPKTTKDTVFWSWQAEYEAFPLERRTIEPALQDIFKREPLDWSRRDRLFPVLCAESNVVETFKIRLEHAQVTARTAEEAARRTQKVSQMQATPSGSNDQL